MSSDPEKAIVFAAAPYANSAPLTQHIEAVCPHARLISSFPAANRGLLQSGQADAALLPVAELLTDPTLTSLEGMGVCARQKVMSVLLKCRRNLQDVKSVALDRFSRTSNALARILLRRKFALSVQFWFPAEGEELDAAVVIGDRALCLPLSPRGDYDLAQQWHQWTGLPFVFATWACRRDHPCKSEMTQIAQAALDKSLPSVEALARSESQRLNLPLETCLDYFRSAVHYKVGPQELAAMDLFARLLKDPNAVL